MRRIFTLLILGFLFASGAGAQSYKFDFTSGKKVKDGYIKITSADRYDQAKAMDMTYALLLTEGVRLLSSFL